MGTSGKTILGKQGNKKGGNNPFDKNELGQILKFGAEELFQDKNDNEVDENEGYDLDKILARAEQLAEEDKNALENQNSDLMSAFNKVATVTFDDKDWDE